ncbi:MULTISPECIES: TioE family transcriptional regulator [unclassified Nocardiopsis]|uniref:TioE family transcriptional regulator n=1 Tax=unclassified Nocardiopsis TaxID=2649073 RepID=UPI0033F008A0
MATNPQSAVRLRPIDLARRHGLSTQAVRNYEADGILPAAERTPSGHRAYTPAHACALRAFLALVPGHGHQRAAAIMRAVNHGQVEAALNEVDLSHAQLLDDRRTLASVREALRDLEAAAPAPEHAPAPVLSGLTREVPEPGPVLIGPLADRLGLRPATLRKWERAGLVHPDRDPRTGYRVYDASAVRDARLVHQLRRGGHSLEGIAPLITQVRAAGGLGPMEATLDAWDRRLGIRGRALLRGAAELEHHLSTYRDSPGHR